jgi:hypothetical protein
LLSLRYHPFGLPLFLGCFMLTVRGICWHAGSAAWSRLDEIYARLKRKGLLHWIFFGFLGLWAVRMGLSYMGIHFFIW